LERLSERLLERSDDLIITILERSTTLLALAWWILALAWWGWG